MSNYEQYEHHVGEIVWVRSDLKGRHAEFCLCYKCDKFMPNEKNNCPIAEGNFQYCVKHELVLPVWECPKFRREV